MNKVKRTERGWGGHFICCHKCLFRRNTLLEYGDRRIVVSTVGLMQKSLDRGLGEDRFEEIGCGRHFETMAFEAEWDGKYWDANVYRQIQFKSPWVLSNINDDDKANDMHEAVVTELTGKLERQVLEEVRVVEDEERE